MNLTDLSSRFRDAAQRRRAQAVIEERLANDREPDECRYLMRFMWQLAMTYREVSPRELQAHVNADKLEAVEALIEAARCSPDRIDAWILATEQSFPVIHDRGYEAGL
ncbi:hypothetical protein VA596_15320 [Amycolatopsis sp., V23-08]|uniref:Uncharacterized protein n=1 Tax=Amycolatopsis heterodermiae TaxID=3110235 RepID=A0ABU5R3X8_9PSEU|nr:hypothetical protein [Amycolatopsis sp., V23-08]MEA5360917.1 hypothetical protein [Amycolatopsis sp., V23-08]